MSRFLALTLPALVVATCAARAEAQSCDPTTFVDECVDADTLQFCSDSNTITVVDCPTELSGTVCGPHHECAEDVASCTGSSPSCLGDSAGDSCLVGPQFGPDGSPWINCVAALTCVFSGDGQTYDETCEDLAIEPCSAGERHKGCADGDVATRCVPFDGTTVANPFGTRCSAFGSTCTVDDTGLPVCEGGDGALCMDAEHLYGDTLRCAPGFRCEGSDFLAFGSCVPESADAGPSSDAGAPPTSDAGDDDDDGGNPGLDSGSPSVDGGAPPPDASSAPRDAGSVFEDDCGGLTAEGECDGDVLRWCQAGRVAERDCAAEELRCLEVGGVSGFACVSESEAAALDGGEDGEALSLYCRCVELRSALPLGVALLPLLSLLCGRARRRARRS